MRSQPEPISQAQQNKVNLHMDRAIPWQVLFDLNLVTGEIEVHGDYAAQLGYELSDFKESIDAWLQRVHPDQHQTLAEAYAACQHGHQSEFVIEHQQRTLTDSWLKVLSIGKVTHWDEDQPVRMLGTHTIYKGNDALKNDVLNTETTPQADEPEIQPETQKERNITEIDSLLESALDVSNLGLIIVSSEGQILQYTSRFAELFDLPEDKMLIGRGQVWETVQTRLKDPDTARNSVINLYQSTERTYDYLELANGIVLERTSYPLMEDGVLKARAWLLRDATQQKRLEEALILNSFAVETASDAVIWVDYDKRITDVNAATSEMLGYTREELIGMPLKQVDVSYDFNLWSGDWDKRRNETYLISLFQSEYKAKDGRIIPVEISANYIIYEEKEYICSFVRDVTERQQAIESLRDRESQLTVIFNQNNDNMSLASVEPDGTLYLTQLNDRYIQSLQSFGLDLDQQEIVNTPLEVYLRDIIKLNPEKLAYTLQKYQQVIQTGEAVYYENNFDLPGGHVYTEVVLTPIFDPPDVCRYVLYSSRDVTERKEANRTLQLINFAVENVSDAVCWMDANGVIIRANKAACTMFDYTYDELLGLPIIDMNLTFQTISSKKIWDQLKAMGSLRWETEIQTKGGRGIPVEVTANYIKFDDIELNCSIIRDITDRKQGELVAKSAQKHLEEEVTRRTAQLKAANAELETFAYSVSHDLRAPLRAIDGFSQALLEDNLDTLDPMGQHYLTRLRAASQNMGQLIDDLLKLSRVTRQEMRLAEVNLSEMAQGIFEELQEQEPQRNVKTVIDNHIIVQGDARLLKVMMMNLLNNAWKFTSNEEQAIIEFKRKPAEESVYYVSDNGAGFDMQYMNKLFNAFQRLHSDDDFEGTGIGLATVKRIIDRHGGKVWVDAKINEGATFYFTLS
ncbi:PAS domain S-box protein [Phototrophicus methaneseepsis]|uniref:histidine kinase n=1 Tax=Phototrophicus methaneseepsis TaxID=2710758 RepID=A0A7S8IFX7_9CHLR|nr:PAS domain S-box protein [Phototrophicus methaneseepsis]QPC83954.1 PAS domain S-box protein [Phototrophicus methaneseepsis]